MKTKTIKQPYTAPKLLFTNIELNYLMNDPSIKIPITDDPVDDEIDPLTKEREETQNKNYSLW